MGNGVEIIRTLNILEVREVTVYVDQGWAMDQVLYIYLILISQLLKEG